MKGILAVGNEMRGDDAVGIFAGRLLEARGFPVVFAYETPENALGGLRKFDGLVVLDAAHFEGGEPFRVVEPDDSWFTHKPGLSKIAKFLRVPVTVIGIKAYKRALVKGISPRARRNAREAVKVVEVCMSIPGVVTSAERKLVDVGGKEKEMRFAVPGLKDGDFVLIHAGVVIERLSREEYDRTREALGFSPVEKVHL
jgi:hydrogenase maturation protease